MKCARTHKNIAGLLWENPGRGWVEEHHELPGSADQGGAKRLLPPKTRSILISNSAGA